MSASAPLVGLWGWAVWFAVALFGYVLSPICLSSRRARRRRVELYREAAHRAQTFAAGYVAALAAVLCVALLVGVARRLR